MKNEREYVKTALLLLFAIFVAFAFIMFLGTSEWFFVAR